MRSLPLTGTGYHKPWFVKGDDFRVVDLKKAAFAVTKKACWICGKPFRKARYAMVCSPESARLLLFKEPPCHSECAEYAMRVCPFIIYPRAQRRSANLPDDVRLEHVNASLPVKIAAENPGEYFLVVVRDFVFHQDRQVMRCRAESVLEYQHWRQGVRQSRTTRSP